MRTAVILACLMIVVSSSGVHAQPQNDLGPAWAKVRVIVPTIEDDCRPGAALTSVAMLDGVGNELATRTLAADVDAAETWWRWTWDAAPNDMGCVLAASFVDVAKAGGYAIRLAASPSLVDGAHVLVAFTSTDGDYRLWYDQRGYQHCDTLADNPIKTGAITTLDPRPLPFDAFPTFEWSIVSRVTGEACVLATLIPIPAASWEAATDGDVRILFGGPEPLPFMEALVTDIWADPTPTPTPEIDDAAANCPFADLPEVVRPKDWPFDDC